jgi:hypothetical protein
VFINEYSQKPASVSLLDELWSYIVDDSIVTMRYRPQELITGVFFLCHIIDMPIHN